jgi:hypothetical protein
LHRRILRDDVARERAERPDLQAFDADLFECAKYDFLTNAAAAQRCRRSVWVISTTPSRIR